MELQQQGCFLAALLLAYVQGTLILSLSFQTLCEPISIERWAIVNFSARCDMSHLSRDLITCGKRKGIVGFALALIRIIFKYEFSDCCYCSV